MESDIQKKIKNILKNKGWKVIKVIQLSENGFPDLLCLKEGKAMFIEVKDTKKKPTQLQKYRIEELQKLGFMAFWTDNVNDIIEIN